MTFLHFNRLSLSKYTHFKGLRVCGILGLFSVILAINLQLDKASGLTPNRYRVTTGLFYDSMLRALLCSRSRICF
jgi:hypothetical protein